MKPPQIGTKKSGTDADKSTTVAGANGRHKSSLDELLGRSGSA